MKPTLIKLKMPTLIIVICLLALATLHNPVSAASNVDPKKQVADRVLDQSQPAFKAKQDKRGTSFFLPRYDLMTNGRSNQKVSSATSSSDRIPPIHAIDAQIKAHDIRVVNTLNQLLSRRQLIVIWGRSPFRRGSEAALFVPENVFISWLHYLQPLIQSNTKETQELIGRMTTFLKFNLDSWSQSSSKFLLLRAYFSWLSEERAWQFLLSTELDEKTKDIFHFFLDVDPSVIQRLPSSVVNQMALNVPARFAEHLLTRALTEVTQHGNPRLLQILSVAETTGSSEDLRKALAEARQKVLYIDGQVVNPLVLETLLSNPNFIRSISSEERSIILGPVARLSQRDSGIFFEKITPKSLESIRHWIYFEDLDKLHQACDLTNNFRFYSPISKLLTERWMMEKVSEGESYEFPIDLKKFDSNQIQVFLKSVYEASPLYASGKLPFIDQFLQSCDKLFKGRFAGVMKKTIQDVQALVTNTKESDERLMAIFDKQRPDAYLNGAAHVAFLLVYHKALSQKSEVELEQLYKKQTDSRYLLPKYLDHTQHLLKSLPRLLEQYELLEDLSIYNQRTFSKLLETAILVTPARVPELYEMDMDGHRSPILAVQDFVLHNAPHIDVSEFIKIFKKAILNPEIQVSKLTNFFYYVLNPMTDIRKEWNFLRPYGGNQEYILKKKGIVTILRSDLFLSDLSDIGLARYLETLLMTPTSDVTIQKFLLERLLEVPEFFERLPKDFNWRDILNSLEPLKTKECRAIMEGGRRFARVDSVKFYEKHFALPLPGHVS